MSAPGYLGGPSLRLIFFGGKGGVGKTTMACVSAIHLALAYPEQQILLLSTDPAHSLSDCLGLPIGDAITPIPLERTIEGAPVEHPHVLSSGVAGQVIGVPGSTGQGEQGAKDERQRTEDRNQAGDSPSSHRTEHSAFQHNCFAWEPDAARLAREFKDTNQGVLKKLADRGTYFDEADIAQFLDLSIPGIDEVMAILEISRLLSGGGYDRLIVDTAPTGHTLRMLALPEQMRRWVKALDLMQEKHRVMASHFTRRRPAKDECDVFLHRLSADLGAISRLLTDGDKTRFVPVTLPEPMAIEETRRLAAELRALSIRFSDILVNRVLQDAQCPFCRSRAEDQAVHLKTLERELGPSNLIAIPLLPLEIRGIPGLQELEEVLWKGKRLVQEEAAISYRDLPLTPLTFAGTPELVLVGGKGGVGKTSVAAAIAIHLARTNTSSKVLLFSTDPAHSLSDAFSIPIGDAITPILLEQRTESRGQRTEEGGHALRLLPSACHSNLLAVEIDADRIFQKLKSDFEQDVQEVFARFLKSGLHARLDQEVMNSLLDFAPPGIDEIMALESILTLRQGSGFDMLVLDTSPTGHLLRFLEMPQIIRQWLQTFFRLLMRYKGVVRMTRVAEKAVNMARGIRRIQECLRDPQKTAFVAVSIAEGMAVEELVDLMDALQKGEIPCRHIVMNRITPDSPCPFCRSARNMQEGYLKDVELRFPEYSIIRIPQFPQPIQGMTGLTRLEDVLFGEPQMKTVGGQAG